MRNHREIILDVMDSMLASAQLEAKPGITLKKFLLELEFLREYPKVGGGGKLSPAQITYIKTVLRDNYKIMDTGNERYYTRQGILF
jgi:hypothetical protein